MGVRKSRYIVADFETTVYEAQTFTEVWAGATTEMFSETDEVKIHHSIDEVFDYLISLKSHIICYFHNLKFDGVFCLSYLMKQREFKPAFVEIKKDGDPPEWEKEKFMKNNTFKCCISAMGQWYSITLKVNGKFIELRDSLKLLPFSVKKIGKSFKTKHQKLEMEYTGFRYAGCTITDEEKAYIANDVLVVREALEFMFKSGHKKLTIGSCCLAEFRNIMGIQMYNEYFPNIYDIELDTAMHRYPNAGEWVRRSYRGGWCYLVRGKERKKFYNGTTADVNSLYPSMMSSESGNRYPVGKPTFWVGDDIDIAELERLGRYYFVRIKTRFYLKPGKLPFVQIKNNLRFNGNECLETSDYYHKKTGQYYTHYWFGPSKDEQALHDTREELTLTMTDFKLLKEHYDLVDFEMLDGCWFRTEIGLFDDYMEKYKQLKLTSEGAMRELAKLFLNNLYGKMASSTDSSFKVPFIRDDGSIGLQDVQENEKKPGYIPVGSAITSYARNFTIRAAQKNYYGPDNPGFIYADTDSIHCDLNPDQIKGIVADDNAFCCWKLEAQWDVAWFTRQKTYIEHVTHVNLKPVEKPYYNVKCAGMPDKCKDLFIKSMERYQIQDTDQYTDEEKEAINKHYNLENFTIGLRLPGKLMPKRIPGGVLLVEGPYEMRALNGVSCKNHDPHTEGDNI